MAIQVIPLAAVPSQTLAVALGGQSARINVYQKASGLYLDLFIDDVAVVVGVVGRNCNVMVRNAYFSFAGDLYFKDTQGVSDPYYTELGKRFVLCYLKGV